MIITSFGLFWRKDEIDWSPGKGQKEKFRLLGRRGSNKNSIKIANFRSQKGVYILYGNYGSYYVGITTKRGIGDRLKENLGDQHENEWDRFSWFGFSEMKKTPNKKLIYEPESNFIEKSYDQRHVIKDLEALLIRAIGGIANSNDARFFRAEEWEQIDLDEVEKYTSRLT